MIPKPAYDFSDVMPAEVKSAVAKLDGPLMISGPHFSATYASLAEVLRESGLSLKVLLKADPDQSRLVKIISPDTSSENLIGRFDKICGATKGCTFRSLSITAAQKDRVAATYLSNLGYGSKQIAELVEDESAFGDSEARTQMMRRPTRTILGSKNRAHSA